ncbi:MAG TPA: TetR/AcrR family transcriptional regulator [Verrucomicrobiae bacterium]|nr:TetR/AcrR family transcriptional regulator [Verrucomicrobiae bacterium]
MSRAARASPRRPARPAQRRKLPRAERERQMLDTAAQVFGRRGYHAAAMDDIARACGVTKPMLYAYFQSKEGLYLATVDRMGRAVLSAVEELLRQPDARQRLLRGAEVIMKFIDRDRHGWAVLFAEGLGEGPVARHVSNYRRRIVQLAALTLTETVPGYAPTHAAEPYAVGMLGAGEALARWWLARPKAPLGSVLEATRLMVSAVQAAYQQAVRPATPGRVA